MKFKVMYGVKPNKLGRLGGHITLIGDDGSTPYDIEWFLDKLIDLFNMRSKSVEDINDQKQHLLENILNLEIGVPTQIVDKADKMVAAIVRVDEHTTLQDLLIEVYDL